MGCQPLAGAESRLSHKGALIPPLEGQKGIGGEWEGAPQTCRQPPQRVAGLAKGGGQTDLQHGDNPCRETANPAQKVIKGFERERHPEDLPGGLDGLAVCPLFQDGPELRRGHRVAEQYPGIEHRESVPTSLMAATI